MISKICVLILLFSFFHLLCCFPPALVDSNKCKKGRGNFPKPGSLCRSFYRCNNWIPVEMMCPGDQHFFPAGGYCVWPEEFPCLEKPKSKECPLPNGNFLKLGTKCKEFYDCCDGKPTVKRCSGDTIFDHIKGKCDWPELVVCPDDISTTESTSRSSILTTSSAPSTSTTEKVITITSNPTSPKILTTGSISQSTPTSTIITSSIPSTSTTEKVVTVTRNPTSTKILTSDSGENSSEEGKSSEESGEFTTKSKSKPTSPTISTLSSSIFDDLTSRKDVFTTPSTVTVDQKETPSSTEVKSTKLPMNMTSSNYESSSTVETIPETVSTTSTAEENLTVSGISTNSTDEIDAKTYTYPNFVTNGTSPGVTKNVDYRDKHSTTMTSGLTNSVTYDVFCPKSDGIFPHPSDRHKFIACVGGNPTVMDCPAKLVYDHKSKSCQYARR